MPSFTEKVRNIMEGKKLDETPSVVSTSYQTNNLSDLAYWMNKKSYNESIIGSVIDHPVRGTGKLIEYTSDSATIEWDNLERRIYGPEVLVFEDAKFISITKEQYSDNPEDVEVDNDEMKTHKKVSNKNKSKKQVDEAMMAIPGTIRGGSVNKLNPLSTLTFSDLIEDEDDPKLAFDGSQQGTKDFKPSTNNPLSTEEGGESASDDGPREEDSSPPDAPKTPKYKEMQDAGKGNVRKTGSSDNAPKSDSSDSSDDSNPFEKKKRSKKTDQSTDKKEEETMAESQKKSYRALTEGMAFGDMDVEGHQSGRYDTNSKSEGDEYKGDMNEHDMGAGEIAVTQEFLVKLMAAVVRANLDEDKLSLISAAVAECCDEDRTLDVADIGMVMSKIKDDPSGSDDMDGYADEGMGAEGDGEVAGPEGGDEHEGKTKLMAGKGRDDVAECGDEEIEESDDSEEDKEDKEDLDESIIGMAAINGVDRGNSTTDVDAGGDAELKMMRRRAGLPEYWKNK